MKTEVLHENNRFVKTVDGLDCELEYLIPEKGFINFLCTFFNCPLNHRKRQKSLYVGMLVCC